MEKPQSCPQNTFYLHTPDKMFQTKKFCSHWATSGSILSVFSPGIQKSRRLTQTTFPNPVQFLSLMLGRSRSPAGVRIVSSTDMLRCSVCQRPSIVNSTEHHITCSTSNMLQFFLRTLLWPYPLKRQTLSSTSGARCPRQLECLCLRNAAGKAWRSLWITFHDPNDIIHGLHSRNSEDSCTLPPDALQYDCIFQTWCNNLLAAAKDSANCRMCAISRLTRCIRTVWHTSKIDSKLWVPGPRWHFSALVLSAWQKSREGHPICNMANLVTHEARKVTRECQSAQFVSGQIWSATNLWSFRKTAQRHQIQRQNFHQTAGKQMAATWPPNKNLEQSFKTPT